MQYIKLLAAAIVVALTAACTDDLYLGQGGSGSAELDNSCISVYMDTPDRRSRAIDMSGGAGFYLNEIWVGVYDRATGKRVGGTPMRNGEIGIDLQNRLTASGVTLYNLVSVSGKSEDGYDDIKLGSEQRLCVVAVANYKGIKTYAGGSLEDALREAKTFNQFCNIDIATNQDFKNQTPMLMGYLYRNEPTISGSDKIYVKVNQFGDNVDLEDIESDQKINLYPADVRNGNYPGTREEYSEDDISVTPTNEGGILGEDCYLWTKHDQNIDHESNYVLKLRRLRAKMNIDIQTAAGITITNVEYKVENQPKSVFLAQRRTHTFGDTNYEFNDKDLSTYDDTKYSPNSADALGHGYYTELNNELDKDDPDGDDDPEESGENVVSWIRPTDNTSFSFEHFENKHWARKDFTTSSDPTADYHEREAKNSDGSLKYLASGADDWNNNASYFVLRLSIRDDNEGRNAVVDYVVHEGFCNTADGMGLTKYDEDSKSTTWSNFGTALKDYSCIRNTDYYYHIQVNGINDIYHTVTQDYAHPNDQSGSLWNIEFLSDNVTTETYYDGQVIYVENSPVSSDKTLSNGTSLVFDKNKDIAFRFLGTVDGNLVDVCYNFERGELDGFAGLWDAPSDATSYLITDTNSNTDAHSSLHAYSNPDFETLIERIKIIPKGGDPSNSADLLTIRQYIDKKVQNEDNKPNVVTDIDGFWLDGSLKKKYSLPPSGVSNPLQASFYIFDRETAIENGTRVKSDYKDGRGVHGTLQDACKLYQICGIRCYNYLNSEYFNTVYASGSKNSKFDSAFHSGKLSMSFSDNADIALCAIAEENHQPKAYFYNCTESDFNVFGSDVLPSVSSTQNISNLSSIPMSWLTIDGKSVADFITNKRTSSRKSTTLDYNVAAYTHDAVAKPDEHMRAVYFFDKKDENKAPGILSTDGLSATYELYAFEQYPESVPEIVFGRDQMIWHKDFYTLIDGDKEEHWCGGQDVVTELLWNHNPLITGYKVEVTGKTDSYTVDENNINRYLKGGIMHFPFPTPRYDNNTTYQVVITPSYPNIYRLVDNKGNQIEKLVLDNALVVKTNNKGKWDFSAGKLKEISQNSFGGGVKPVEYDGLVINYTGSESNAAYYPNNNGKYLQLPSGSTEKNNFELYFYRNGKLTINASSNGGDKTDRSIHIAKVNDDGTYDIVDLGNGKISGSSSPYIKDIYVDQPTKYIIYCDGNYRMYSIVFERF